MKTLEKMTVTSLITRNLKTTHVFKKYGINFCYGGEVTIKTAADYAKVDYHLLETELINVDNSINPNYNYNQWEFDFLIDHIINFHHSYIVENIPLIINYASRVVQVHSRAYPELIQIQRLFSELSTELVAQLKEEENILYPVIKS